MKRYSFALKKTFIDADNAEAALREMVKSGHISITESEIPQKVKLYCTVTPTPNPNGQYSATAKLQHKNGDLEMVAQADAPSAERAMLALGVNNPQAHTTHIYRKRFGTEYELIIGSPPKAA